MPRDSEVPGGIAQAEHRGGAEALMPQMSVEVWNSTMIDLPGGGMVSLSVDQVRLSAYLQNKLIPPFVEGGATHWKYSFDLRPRPKPGNLEFDNLSGLTVYGEATVYIFIDHIWSSLANKTIDNLLMELCKTVAHETDHVVQYSNPDLREKARQDGAGRDWWKKLSQAVGWSFSVGDGLIAGELVRRYTGPKVHVDKNGVLTRRDFMKLAGGIGLGVVLAKPISAIIEWGAASGFDRFIDPSHKESYQAEADWQELRGIIEIGEFMAAA